MASGSKSNYDVEIIKSIALVPADIQKELVSIYREAFQKELAWLKKSGKTTTCSMEPLVAFTWIFGGKTLFIAREGIGQCLLDAVLRQPASFYELEYWEDAPGWLGKFYAKNSFVRDDASSRRKGYVKCICRSGPKR